MSRLLMAMEEALYDSHALRGFAGIDLKMAAVPEATTILNFRHWQESHELSQALFAEASAMLEERGLPMRQGAIVDATIIAAPSSTKNNPASARCSADLRPGSRLRTAGATANGAQHRQKADDASG